MFLVGRVDARNGSTKGKFRFMDFYGWIGRCCKQATTRFDRSTKILSVTAISTITAGERLSLPCQK
jgi:hypothetical protein